MKPEDVKTLAATLNAMCELYRREPVSITLLGMYSAALENYSIEEICAAAVEHTRTAESGRFMPTPADFIAILDGKRPSPSEVIAHAKMKTTPFGIIARIFIGTWDLDNQTDFYLIERAKEFLAGYPEVADRAREGRYTDHEIMIMLKHDVSPVAPFLPAAAKPRPDVAQLIRDRAFELSISERFLFLTDKSKNGYEMLTGSISSLIDERISASDSETVTNQYDGSGQQQNAAKTANLSEIEI